MTRQEWIEEMNSFSALFDWCRENGECEYVFDDFIYEDSLEDYVAEDIRNFDYDWTYLRDALNGIDTGYPWYRVNGSFDYVGYSEHDYDELKDEVLDCLDENGYFDDEDDDDQEEHVMPDEPVEIPDEPEIDAVDLNSFDSMYTVIWGMTQDTIEPPQEPEDTSAASEAAFSFTEYVMDMAGQDDSIAPVDLDALPF